MSDLRVERDRSEAERRAANLRRNHPDSTQKYLGTVYNGGLMPSSVPAWFLTYPTQVTGPETEGSAGTFLTDTSNPVPVLVIGTTAPSVGDVLPARNIGGIWVAERGGGGGGGTVACSPCNIPAQNLTLSWTNVLSGNGSTTLIYSAGPPASWASGCSNSLLYKLLCTGGNVELRVIYFTAGSCPTGTEQYCSNMRVTPYGLTLSSYTCSPFSMTFLSRSATCPAITSSGYTSFTVTYP
jgi:hypothetical protein